MTITTITNTTTPQTTEIYNDESALQRQLTKIFGVVLLAFSLLFLVTGVGAIGGAITGLLGSTAIATGDTLFMMGLLGSVTGLHFAFIRSNSKESAFFTTLGVGPFSLRIKGSE